jgi:SAM-dependent methyltransferase
MLETTLDYILNHRVAVEQPKKGFRIAVDTVLLAAAVPAMTGQHILDIGCGVGGAMLCVAARVTDLSLTGIEIQPELVELCRRNIEQNGLSDHAEVLGEDIKNFIPEPTYDHALMNPPYHDTARHDVSSNPLKGIANSATADDLAVWIARAGKALKPNGTLTIIHRADCQDSIIAIVQQYFDDMAILPILPKQDMPPKRIIIRATKNNRTAEAPLLCQPLILHNSNDRYTDAAEGIVRGAQSVVFNY